MAIHQIKGFVTMQMPRYEGDTGAGRVDFYTYDPRKFSGNESVAVVREETISIEVPDDYDPRQAYIRSLDEQIESARAAFTARVTELQELRSKYLAIENTPT